jgi:hypothetical protein
MRELRTEIEINGTIDQVWEVLTDFNSFPEWNPFIKKIEGELKVGAQLKVLIESPDGKVMTFKPTVKILEPITEFRWLGNLLIPGVFDGEHIFQLEQIDANKTNFVHRENFGGLLVPLFWKSVNSNTRREFEEMNKSFKERIETN